MEEGSTPMPVREPRYVPTREAAKIRCQSEGTLCNERSRGTGPPYIKVGRRVLYDIEDIYEFMRKHKIDPESR